MKIIEKYALAFAMLFGLVACDAVIGSDDDDDDDDTITTEQIIPPTDLTEVAVVNNDDDFTATGAVDSFQAAYRLDLFAAINEQRLALGLNSLNIDVRLDELAEEHNLFMQAQAAADDSDEIFVSHDGSSTRAGTVFGYLYITVGENVAAVQGFAPEDVNSAFTSAWANSDGHQVNIENEDFTHTGVDVLVDSASGVIYATQIFAESP